MATADRVRTVAGPEGRINAMLGKLFEHRVRVLVEHGRVQRGQLRRCGLTENDLFAQLRQRGALRLDGIRYVLYEATGGVRLVDWLRDKLTNRLQWLTSARYRRRFFRRQSISLGIASLKGR